MNFDHPAFSPYRSLIAALGLGHAPPAPRSDGLDALNALAERLGTTQAHGHPLRFVALEGRLSAREYETHILHTGQVPTRADTWHDVLNALVWLRFPRFKSALNAAHGAAIARETDSLRGRRRDALTMLDESGVWVGCPEPGLARLLPEREWQALFWLRRHEVETGMRFVVVGHALLEKALAPYPAMTGKCLMLHADARDPDALEPHAIAALADIDTPRQLAPLPVQGIPGWDPANGTAAYYANQAVFRPRGAPSPAARAG